ncbi:MAG TPA: TIGR00730 family Rossman fold protein [Planctomycetota bacterium]|nr:TIGR00730 family Rossman fold protein [Planctomycetota bacterium]
MRRTRICVFCGSCPGDDPAFAQAARELGNLMADRGLELVYGGGSVGLMGVVADTLLSRGGVVRGVIPHSLFVREVGHRGLTECKIVDSMHERKQAMADMAHAFLSLPGGYGTLDETFEALTWAQLGIHEKPVVLVNVKGFWDPLVASVDRMVSAGFLKKENRELLNVARDPASALDLVERWKPARPVEKWLTREQR